jgi:hypothetical protein
VGPAGAHAPREWRRCKTRDACAAGEGKDHTARGLALLADARQRGSPGACTCASSCTRATSRTHSQRTQRASGGDLQLNRKVGDMGREQPRQDGARQGPWEAKKPVRRGPTRDWDFRTQRRRPALDHPVRSGLFGRERDDHEARTALVRNRLGWAGSRIVLGYRHRWTGTAPFQRDGKPQVGLGDGQGRRGAGQTRHVSRVSTASSLLMRSLGQRRVQDWARRTLTPIGAACRAVKAETLERVVDWMVETLTVEHWSIPAIKAVLAQS